MPFWDRWLGKLDDPDPHAEARADQARLTVSLLLEQTRRQMEAVQEREERIYGGRRRPATN